MTVVAKCVLLNLSVVFESLVRNLKTLSLKSILQGRLTLVFAILTFLRMVEISHSPPESNG